MLTEKHPSPTNGCAHVALALTSRVTRLSHRRFRHEKNRNERECKRLQERLQQVLAGKDKAQGRAPAMKLINEKRLERPGGRKKWSSAET